MKNSDAIKLFSRREYKELQGKKRFNVVALAVIFFLATLGIGFGSASLRFLKYKMDDRFANCIDIVVDQIYGKGPDVLKDFLMDNEESLGIESREPVYFLSDRFSDVNGRKCQLDGRSLSASSPILYSNILDGSNVIKKCSDSLRDDQIPIIISLDGLKKLGVDSLDFVEQYGTANHKDFTFDIPVYAIVKELPDMCDFLATSAYLKQEIAPGSDHWDITKDKYQRKLLLCFADSVSDKAKDRLVGLGLEVEKEEPYFGSWNNNYTLLTAKYDCDSCKPLYDSVYLIAKKEFGAKRLYDFDIPEADITRNPNLYSCYMSRDSLVQKVELLKTRLKDETNYTLDMARINSLKNLATVQRMGNILSYCVIGLAVIFICVFICFMLNTHFQKIQRNLGTFKAFGVSNQTLIYIYMRLLVQMLAVAFLLAFAVALCVTYCFGLFSCGQIEPGYQWIDVLVWQNGLLLGLSVVASVVSAFIVSHSLLRHTPGDLIYHRN